MPLVHRTNYEGREILASKGKGDRHVDFNAIWTQFSTTRRASTCCFGFGKRRIFVKSKDLKEEHEGIWNLFLVTEHFGKQSDHYFYKFVLIPSGTENLGKQRCTKDLGWTWIGEVDASSAMRDLTDLLKEYYLGDKSNDDSIDKHHVHVGLKITRLSQGG